MKRMKMTLKSCIFAIFCTLLNYTCAYAQQNNQYLEYIQKYHTLAIDQMNRHRIPASITLSQGLLESAAGRSTLATQAHNHFGIKVGTGWNGPYIVRDDDAKGEHFRKYNTDAESYEDHSLFLKKSRYASLFKLDIRDYKGWAKGLKACGYATNPAYAESLIRIIENYQLYQYDSFKGSMGGASLTSESDEFFASHPIRKCNKNYYIVLQPGDQLETVAEMVGVKKRKLLSYNDLPKDYVPGPGSIIYLEKKRSRADKSFKYLPHILQDGQSIYDVAQMYGVKLKSIYKMNHFTADYKPKVGDLIRVY